MRLGYGGRGKETIFADFASTHGNGNLGDILDYDQKGGKNRALL